MCGRCSLVAAHSVSICMTASSRYLAREETVRGSGERRSSGEARRRTVRCGGERRSSG